MQKKTVHNPSASPAPSRYDSLDCIPVKNPHIREKHCDNGEILLTYQVEIRPWFKGIFKKITNRESDIINRKLQLDLLGVSVWQMISGTHSVRQIIDTFQSTHQLNRREAEMSVTIFIKELGKRGLIALQENDKQ